MDTKNGTPAMWLAPGIVPGSSPFIVLEVDAEA